MVTIGIVTRVLGLDNYMTPYGVDYSSLFLFCLVWRMGGSFISLLLSKFFEEEITFIIAWLTSLSNFQEKMPIITYDIKSDDKIDV